MSKLIDIYNKYKEKSLNRLTDNFLIYQYYGKMGIQIHLYDSLITKKTITLLHTFYPTTVFGKHGDREYQVEINKKIKQIVQFRNYLEHKYDVFMDIREFLSHQLPDSREKDVFYIHDFKPIKILIENFNKSKFYNISKNSEDEFLDYYSLIYEHMYRKKILTLGDIIQMNLGENYNRIRINIAGIFFWKGSLFSTFEYIIKRLHLVNLLYACDKFDKAMNQLQYLKLLTT